MKAIQIFMQIIKNMLSVFCILWEDCNQNKIKFTLEGTRENEIK